MRPARVVWGRRIDPCRIRIDSVPLPDSDHAWHDAILHDVVPNGERVAWGMTFSVFDELIRMDPSGEPTWQTELTSPTEDDKLALHERFASADLGIEDWSTVRMLCKQCSESNPHQHANPDDATPIRRVARPYAFAGPRDAIERNLSAWTGEGPGREWAGQETVERPAHQ